MSATYRQSSVVRSEIHTRDPQNRLLARGPRFRLDAETIRDQALAIAGLLSKEMYGPPVMPPQPESVWKIVYSGDRWLTSVGDGRYRRGLYTFWRRTSPYPSMITFDAPSREYCISRRLRTNTPLQALVTLNDPVYIEAAQGFARRMIREGGDSIRKWIAYGLEIATSHEPSERELDVLVSLFESELERYRASPQAARAMATDPLGPLPDGLDIADAAAMSIVANVILNLDEVLVKE